MSYPDRYVKGSFRGVSFLTRSATTTFGRRQPSWALPFEELGVAHVDLGRAPRHYEIKAFLIGADYDKDRDKLIAALEEAGPALLVHPYHGRKMVIVKDDIRITESTESGGQAEIEFVAIEARDKVPPAPPTDSRGGMLNAASAARSISRDDFSNPVGGLNLSKVADFVAAANLDALENVLGDMRKLNGAIGSVLSIPSNFANQLDSISIEATSLIRTPTALFDAIDGTLEKIIGAVNRVAGALGDETSKGDVIDRVAASQGSLSAAVTSASAFGIKIPNVPNPGTADRTQQQINQDALKLHMRAIALMHCSDAATGAAFASAGRARAFRNLLVDAINDLADGPIEPTTAMHGALKDAAAAAYAHLSTIALGTAEVTAFTPADTLPMLVIAHQLYGDATRTDELIARNPQVQHPGMVQGEVPIEAAIQ